MTEIVGKPQKGVEVGKVIKPMADHGVNPWPEKDPFHSLLHQIKETRGGMGVFPYLSTRLQLDLLFDDVDREEKRRATGYESGNIRGRTELKIVDICRDLNPGAFIAAGVGDIAEAHQWLSELKDKPLVRNIELALRQNSLALIPILAAITLNRGMSLQDGIIAGGALGFNTAASLALTQAESLRRPVTPDPIHFRLAAAVALTQDIAKNNNRITTMIGHKPHLERRSAVGDLIEGTLIVGTKSDANAISQDDEMLFEPDRSQTKRQKSMNLERSFLFQEVLTDQKIGLKLLATYMYQDKRYEQKVLNNLTPELQAELNKITAKTIKANEDPEVGSDPNNKIIAQALEEIELPEMMELLLKVAQSKRNGMKVLFADKHYHRNFKQLRTDMMESLTAKMNMPLVGAVLALRNELPPQIVVRKLINNFIHVIPPVSSKEGTVGAAKLPERLNDENEYTKAANISAWNSMRIFVTLMKSNGMTDAKRDELFIHVQEAWKKRAAFKVGIPLPVQFMKLLEATMDDSLVATTFVYDEISNLMKRSCDPQSTVKLISTEQIVKNADNVIKSFNKRGVRYSSIPTRKKLEVARLNSLADEMIGYSIYQLDFSKAYLQREMTAGMLDPEVVQWGAKVNALKSVACAILSSRKESLNECPDIKEKLLTLVRKIDDTISDAIQKRLVGALPIINQTIGPAPV